MKKIIAIPMLFLVIACNRQQKYKVVMEQDTVSKITNTYTRYYKKDTIIAYSDTEAERKGFADYSEHLHTEFLLRKQGAEKITKTRNVEIFDPTNTLIEFKIPSNIYDSISTKTLKIDKDYIVN